MGDLKSSTRMPTGDEIPMPDAFGEIYQGGVCVSRGAPNVGVALGPTTVLSPDGRVPPTVVTK